MLVVKLFWEKFWAVFQVRGRHWKASPYHNCTGCDCPVTFVVSPPSSCFPASLLPNPRTKIPAGCKWDALSQFSLCKPKGRLGRQKHSGKHRLRAQRFQIRQARCSPHARTINDSVVAQVPPSTDAKTTVTMTQASRVQEGTSECSPLHTEGALGHMRPTVGSRLPISSVYDVHGFNQQAAMDGWEGGNGRCVIGGIVGFITIQHYQTLFVSQLMAPTHPA